MSPPERVKAKAQAEIRQLFEESPQRVFSGQELGTVLAAKRGDWELPSNWGTAEFIDFLMARMDLSEKILRSEKYPDKVLYAWGDVSPFQLAQAVKPQAYLSHGTAVFLHGLTEELPKTLYVNAEQSPKRGGGQLTQASLDTAFRRQARTSSYVLKLDGYRVTLLSGKFTGRLEVARMPGPDGELVEATKLERTLIDITVRPVYAGGVYKVLEAFETAQDRVSVNTLAAVLKKLDYTYPYHQALGFYMKRAGYDPHRLAPLSKLPMEYDFYLAHGMKETDYDSEWRLFIPKGM